MEGIGIYVHIPFCRAKCKYCDFFSRAATDDEVDAYFSALNKEIHLYKGLIDGSISTVYIGGGTPSLPDGRYITKLIEALKSSFRYYQPTEVTIECNPESLTAEKLIAYKEAGINRISIGIQSLNDECLSAIGRLHDVAGAVKAIRLAKEHFENVSVDLMVGLPNQTVDDVVAEITELIALGVTHFSVYSLKVEEGTPLAAEVQSGAVKIDEDLAVDMYDAAVAVLEKYGYPRYEISNFAERKYESKHNLSYWQRIPYLGLGAGAFSFYNSHRYNNVLSIKEYERLVSARYYPVENLEKIEGEDAEFEEIMLSLRTRYGLDIAAFNAKFNADFHKKYADALKKTEKHLNISNGILTVRPESLYILNTILIEFM